jgi:hypothetical protein
VCMNSPQGLRREWGDGRSDSLTWTSLAKASGLFATQKVCLGIPANAGEQGFLGMNSSV